MTKNMSLTERQEQFGKTFASNPKSFMLLPGDKVVLRIISEVCKQVLKSYQSVLSPHEKKNKSKSTTFSSGKQFTAMTNISNMFYVFFYFHDVDNRFLQQGNLEVTS